MLFHGYSDLQLDSSDLQLDSSDLQSERELLARIANPAPQNKKMPTCRFLLCRLCFFYNLAVQISNI